MVIEFKLTDEIPVLHFNVIRLLLPSPEKRARMLGIRKSRDRDELEKSIEVFSKYSFEDTVLENFQERPGINTENFLQLYAPGLRKEVREILERKSLIAKRE